MSSAVADLGVPSTPSISFAELGVPDALVASLAARGITEPTAVQAAVLPDALAGRDLCGKAPTGSGKTIAFGIPLVLGTPRADSRRPRALVLVPTRELASQVRKELVALAGHGKPSVEALYGGVGFDRQVKSLRRGVDIVVATPGRLADLIGQGHLRLDAVERVVIDEADRMADMGFLPEVRRLLDQCPDDRQTLLLSATLDGDVDVLIKNYQHDPARHEIAGDDDHDGDVEHFFWRVARTEKVTVTAQVVARAGQTVVFCRTKRGAERVARQLSNAGVPAAAIHGDRSQNQRERALGAFARGEVAALVATDVAARGIHVDDVACVVHFDPPEDDKAYVHRSGRTGRAGATGMVVTLVPPDVRKHVSNIQRDLGLPARMVDPDIGKLEASTTPMPAARPFEPMEPSGRDAGTSDRSASHKRSSGQHRSSGTKRSTGDRRTGDADRPSKRSSALRDRSDRDDRRGREDRPKGADRPRRDDRPKGADRPRRDDGDGRPWSSDANRAGGDRKPGGARSGGAGSGSTSRSRSSEAPSSSQRAHRDADDAPAKPRRLNADGTPATRSTKPRKAKSGYPKSESAKPGKAKAKARKARSGPRSAKVAGRQAGAPGAKRARSRTGGKPSGPSAGRAR